MDTDPAWELLTQGDVAGAMRGVLTSAESLPIGELARLSGMAAELRGFTDLVDASSALAAGPGVPQALYDFGYACVGRGAAILAIPALSAALRAVPDSVPVLTVLAVAFERDERHAEAVALLERHEELLSPWPHGYLLTLNAILSGDLATARRHADRLPAGGGDPLEAASARVRRMLARAEAVPGPLDDRDLRGWQFVLTGGVLGSLSPFGLVVGLFGWFVFFLVGFGRCRF